MGYRSDVGIRCAIESKSLITFYNELIVAMEKEMGYEDDLAIGDLPLENFNDINNVIDTFYNVLADTPLYRLAQVVVTKADEEHPEYVVIEYHGDWLKWYNEFPYVEFWESICGEKDYVLEWSYVRIGEDFEDIVHREDCDYRYIQPLYIISEIDWGE